MAQTPAVGCQHCGTILHSGIVSLEQLSQTPLDKLHKHIMRLQVQNFSRADLCPAISDMSIWIKQAQQLMVAKTIAKRLTVWQDVDISKSLKFYRSLGFSFSYFSKGW